MAGKASMSVIVIAPLSLRIPPWLPPPKPGVTMRVPYAYIRSQTWARNAKAMHLVSDLVCPHLVQDATNNAIATAAKSAPSTIAQMRLLLRSPMAANIPSVSREAISDEVPTKRLDMIYRRGPGI